MFNATSSNLHEKIPSFFGLTTFVAVITTVGIFWIFCGVMFSLACFRRLPVRSLEGGPLFGALTRNNRWVQKETNDGGEMQPDIEEVQLVCDKGVGEGRLQDAQPQALSIHTGTSESLLDVSFFVRMPQPQPHSPVANSPPLPPNLFKNEFHIATTSVHLTTTVP